MNFLAAVKIGDSVQQGLDTFFAFLPRLLGFLLILLIGYIVAKVVKGILTKVLERVGLDRALHTGSTGQYVNKVAPDVKPSRTIGAIAFWFIFLGAISIAVSQLGIAALTDFVASIAAYLPNVVAAILIFVIAGVVAAAVGGLVARTMGDTPTGKVVGSVVPVLVMAIATFMILNQLQIATEIVTITYAALIGGVFLAMALAFGLGGRDGRAADARATPTTRARRRRTRSRTTWRRARSARSVTPSGQGRRRRRSAGRRRRRQRRRSTRPPAPGRHR